MKTKSDEKKPKDSKYGRRSFLFKLAVTSAATGAAVSNADRLVALGKSLLFPSNPGIVHPGNDTNTQPTVVVCREGPFYNLDGLNKGIPSLVVEELLDHKVGSGVNCHIIYQDCNPDGSYDNKYAQIYQTIGLPEFVDWVAFDREIIEAELAKGSQLLNLRDVVNNYLGPVILTPQDQFPETPSTPATSFYIINDKIKVAKSGLEINGLLSELAAVLDKKADRLNRKLDALSSIEKSAIGEGSALRKYSGFNPVDSSVPGVTSWEEAMLTAQDLWEQDVRFDLDPGQTELGRNDIKFYGREDSHLSNKFKIDQSHKDWVSATIDGATNPGTMTSAFDNLDRKLTSDMRYSLDAVLIRAALAADSSNPAYYQDFANYTVNARSLLNDAQKLSWFGPEAVLAILSPKVAAQHTDKRRNKLHEAYWFDDRYLNVGRIIPTTDEIIQQKMTQDGVGAYVMKKILGEIDKGYFVFKGDTPEEICATPVESMRGMEERQELTYNSVVIRWAAGVTARGIPVRSFFGYARGQEYVPAGQIKSSGTVYNKKRPDGMTLGDFESIVPHFASGLPYEKWCLQEVALGGSLIADSNF